MYQFIAPAPLPTIDKIVNHGGLQAHRRVEETLKTNRDGLHIPRGNVPQAVGDMPSAQILFETAFSYERTNLSLLLAEFWQTCRALCTVGRQPCCPPVTDSAEKQGA